MKKNLLSLFFIIMPLFSAIIKEPKVSIEAERESLWEKGQKLQREGNKLLAAFYQQQALLHGYESDEKIKTFEAQDWEKLGSQLKLNYSTLANLCFSFAKTYDYKKKEANDNKGKYGPCIVFCNKQKKIEYWKNLGDNHMLSAQEDPRFYVNAYHCYKAANEEDENNSINYLKSLADDKNAIQYFKNNYENDKQNWSTIYNTLKKLQQLVLL